MPLRQTPNVTRTTYFTCKLFCSGIGDQLHQLRTLYTLGRSFGLTYVHTPFDNRWCPGLDVNKFFGLAEGEREIGEFPKSRLVAIRFPELLDRFHRQLPVPDPSAGAAGHSPPILQFVATPEIYSQKPNFQLLTPDLAFDLRRKFDATHRDTTTINPFRTHKIRVAVHIRRGDCTWFDEGQNHVFPFLGKRVAIGAADINLRRALPTSFYSAALNDLAHRHGPDHLEVRIYSEGQGMPIIGPLRGKDLLIHFLAAVLRPVGIRRSWMPTVNIFNWKVQRRLLPLRREIHRFARNHPDAVLRLGRSAALTREVICAFALADIIVIARRHAFPDLGLGLNIRQMSISPEGSDTSNLIPHR